MTGSLSGMGWLNLSAFLAVMCVEDARKARFCGKFAQIGNFLPKIGIKCKNLVRTLLFFLKNSDFGWQFLQKIKKLREKCKNFFARLLTAQEKRDIIKAT